MKFMNKDTIIAPRKKTFRNCRIAAPGKRMSLDLTN